MIGSDPEARGGPWIVIGCLVLLASPLIAGIAGGSGLNVYALLTAGTMGVVGLVVYLRMLSRTRRDLDR